MFEQKREKLKEPATKTSNNAFVNEGLKSGAETQGAKGAKKFSTTGNVFVDQFGSMSIFRNPRPIKDIFNDMALLWDNSPEKCLKLALYTRLITRSTSIPTMELELPTQRGAGLKHEGIVRFLWLAIYYKDIFYKNIHLIIAAGSWKDIFEMLTLDLEYHNWEGRQLDWNMFQKIIHAGLSNEDHSELVKKYLPQIQANSQCTTVRAESRNMIAKWVADSLKLNYEDYRKLKSSGTAHEWQQHISRQDFDKIDFASIHGRALSILTGGEFLKNNGLEEEYTQWIEEQPVAKFTGYPYELKKRVQGNLKPYQVHTLNKQFEGLVEKAVKDATVDTDLLAVIDISASMTSESISDPSVTARDVAGSLAIFFSEMLEGEFKNSCMVFSNTTRLHRFNSSTFVNKCKELPYGYGTTNFMSVSQEFVNLLGRIGSEEDFPGGILCISDGEFDPASLNETNVEYFRNTLREGGFSDKYVDEFKIILWDVPNTFHGRSSSDKPRFETYGDTENVFYLSGLDGSVVSFILGGQIDPKTGEKKNAPKTAEELFEAAMDQELLNLAVI